MANPIPQSRINSTPPQIPTSKPVTNRIFEKPETTSQGRVVGVLKTIGSAIFGLPVFLASVAMFGVAYIGLEVASKLMAYVKKEGFGITTAVEDDPFTNTARNWCKKAITGSFGFFLFPYKTAATEFHNWNKRREGYAEFHDSNEIEEAASHLPPPNYEGQETHYQEDIVSLIERDGGPSSHPHSPYRYSSLAGDYTKQIGG